jgi:very-short-patch-repair endonuclease
MSFHRWNSAGRTWKVLKPIGRKLRKDATEVEALLWEELRGRRLGSYKIRRQWTIGTYVPDFYCAECKLAIEVDGPIHLGNKAKTKDAERDRDLLHRGIEVLRITNEEVNSDLTAVLVKIRKKLESMNSK